MPANILSRTTIVALLVATTAGLVARSWLQLQLIENGMPRLVAADASYLLVPPILVLLLFPLWRSEKLFLADQFRRRDLSLRLIVQAIGIGILMRLLWWSQLIAGASFGVYASSDADAIVGPVFTFQCSTPGVVFLGFLVMAVLVPLIEEVVHRSYVQTALDRHGLIKAVLLSALIFAIFHKLSSWPFAFLAGIVFGVQYWSSRSLWPSLISHATFNGLMQLDWRCLSGQWNPRPADLPLVLPGTIASVVFVSCLILLLVLLHKMITGTPNTPR